MFAWQISNFLHRRSFTCASLTDEQACLLLSDSRRDLF